HRQQEDDSVGAAGLPGAVPHRLPAAVHRCGDRLGPDRDRLRPAAAALPRRYHGGRGEGASAQTSSEGSAAAGTGVGAPEAYVVRSITAVTTEPGAVRIGLEALRATSLPGTPGWLTGESMTDQGIETEMPNLPRGLQLPPLES